jgi:hypothetical protein
MTAGILARYIIIRARGFFSDVKGGVDAFYDAWRAE